MAVRLWISVAYTSASGHIYDIFRRNSPEPETPILFPLWGKVGRPLPTDSLCTELATVYCLYCVLCTVYCLYCVLCWPACVLCTAWTVLASLDSSEVPPTIKHPSIAFVNSLQPLLSWQTDQTGVLGQNIHFGNYSPGSYEVPPPPKPHLLAP